MNEWTDPDVIWVEAPADVKAFAAMGQALADVWPDAVLDANHGRPGEWLCLRRTPTSPKVE